jgi:hypothetical protein
MEENKIDLNFLERENSNIVFGEQEIKVKSFLDIIDRQAILDAYFAERYLSPTESHLEAEFNLILNVINLMTDIRVETSDNEKAIEFVNNLLNTGLWYKIKGAIINFAELQRDIEKISQHKNLEGKLNQIIDKVGLFIDNISKLDWSPEGVQILAKEIVPQLQQLAQVFPNIENNAPVSGKKSKKSSEKAQSTS